MRAVLLVLVLVVAGCGVRPTGVIGGALAPDGEVDGLVLYLVSDGAVVPVVRPGAPADPFALLAAGPTGAERERGLTSEVPAAAVPTEIAQNGDSMTLRLPLDVAVLSDLAAEQLACTATAGRPVTLVGDGTSRVTVTCEPRPNPPWDTPPGFR